MSLKDIAVNGLALLIGIPAVIVAGTAFGLILPVVLIGSAIIRPWRNAHSLTVLEDFGGECAMKCSCGERFYSSSFIEENVEWKQDKNRPYMTPKCPRDT